MNNEIIKMIVRCLIRTHLEIVGGKSKLIISFLLSHTPLRLSELKRIITDIIGKMLVQEHKNLVESNLVEWKKLGEVPPRVEYELKQIRYKILPLISEIKNFAINYQNSQ